MSYYVFDRRLRMAHPLRLWFSDLWREIRRAWKNRRAWRND